VSFISATLGASVPASVAVVLVWEVYVETITVVASRPNTFSLSEMETLVGSALVIVVLAWMVLARMRRQRHQPHA
jgi:hypothetical protein